ncbi:ATP-binding protein [Kingella kingae]|uniref:ATP-binding protein n=1 Tax=Kingella kingae TaxID=504 RepID=UPI00254D43CA|nr:ATP-binding protein [Kingella kingae]MDK4545160.1 ATP-binding protein [Kingella kingae]MDK4631353.1 ATP-binding protein [Kingella kingae]
MGLTTTNNSVGVMMQRIMAGLEVQETVQAACAQHGSYTQTVYRNGDKTPCPHCEWEAKLSQEKQAAQARQRALLEKLGKAGIPKRHQACTVSGYHATNDKQREFKNTVVDYVRQMQSGGLKRNLVLLGNCGTGKTHMACAVGNAAVQSGKTVLFLTASEMIRRVQAALKNRDESEFDVMQRIAGVDLLIVDEIGVQYTTESANRIVTEIVNERYNRELPTVFLSNLSLPEFCAALGDRAISRMREDGCKPFVCDWEDYRMTQHERI